jgi:hypothetical protein
MNTRNADSQKVEFFACIKAIKVLIRQTGLDVVNKA